MTKRYIRHASELVTCKGQAPKRGKEMSDIGLIEDGGVLIHDDKIFAVGTTEELDKMINPDEYEMIDATGKTVLPGFVDSHTHFVFGGYRADEFTWRLKGDSYMSIMERGYSYNEIEQDLWEARLYASKQKSFYSLLITACLFLLTVALLRFIHYRRERKSLLQRLKANEEQIQRNEQTLKNISDVKDSLQNEIQIYKTKERQLSKEKDEQLKRTNEEIRQKIMQLEKLSHTKDELEKNLLTLRSENSNLKKREQAREEERKKIEESERLQNERLYDKFRSPAGWEPTDTDWHKLFISVDKLYPKMVTTLQKSTSLNESERKICYLSKIGVKPGAIEILLSKGNETRMKQTSRSQTIQY